MKKLIIFLLPFVLFSCEEDPVLGPAGTVNVNFNAKFAGNDFVLGQPYLFGSTNKVKFDKLNFFITNVALLEAETEDQTDLLEIAYADFSDNASGEAEKLTFGSVPAVQYKGIEFSIGVPSSLNKSSASGYGAGHPLKKNFDSHFWKDGGSFFFLQLAGIYDLNGDGVFDPAPTDNSFELFPAKNSNFKTVRLNKDFALGEGETLNLNIDFDILKLLQGTDNQTIDFTDPANLSTYNPVNDDLSALLMGNLETAMELK